VVLDGVLVVDEGPEHVRLPVPPEVAFLR
jgi:hypothetical protein